MPVLHVKALNQHAHINVSEALRKTCIAIAEAYGCAAEDVSATWQELSPDNYIVGGQGGAVRQPDKTHPPLGQLYGTAGKKDIDIEAVLAAAGQTLGESLELGDNVFITYHQVKKNRVYNPGAVDK